MNAATIKIQRNGPYLVSGDFRVVDHEGREYAVGDRKVVALCRCGRSQTRPFCDGHHKTCGFVSDEAAP